MPFDFLRKDSKPSVSIVIIGTACCMPGMAPFDEAAHRIVKQAIAETGVEARVKMMPATTAMMGGVPKEIMGRLIGVINQTGQMPLPAVLVNGEPVSYGVPELEDIKSALLQTANTHTNMTKEEKPNESAA